MASPANLLRTCLRTTAHARWSSTPQTAAVQRALVARRLLSTTQRRPGPRTEKPEDDAEIENVRDFRDPGEYLRFALRDQSISPRERKLNEAMLEEWDKLPAEEQYEFDRIGRAMHDAGRDLRRKIFVRKDSFWNPEETDEDYITEEIGEDDFQEDDIMAMGHAKLEEHREAREYARISVWEMPLLSKLAKPFQPPTEEQVLRFRYTTYMGEFHPADRKVVVEFSPRDLPDLSEAQQLKLKKLAGPRYNPEKDIVKMSCERFEHQAQNKRYLGDMVEKMIAAAKDPTDMLEDVPLDLRHHKFKPQIKFPKEWLLTEERKKALEAQRQQALLLDEQKRSQGGLIDGVQTIQHAMLTAKPVEEAVPVLRGRSQRGRR